ncbi:MAG: M6 family metalloprotease domain-containing protein [candidate division Zixibacteria bacterium]|nr:M6 family metalloprotease domain-containing protein [candidate division Zixibacteria bacterium]
MQSFIKNPVSLTAFILFLFYSLSQAVMPPAPPEWYSERMKQPIPKNYSRAIPAQAVKIQNEMAKLPVKSNKADTDNLLIILVEFPDHPANSIMHPQSAYEDMMFSIGVLSTGSLVEYYQEVSYGAFTPAGTVSVWIMAPHPYSYYTDGSYGTGSFPNNSQGLLEDCVSQLDLLFDFSDFDNDGDGFAEGIFLVHAGPGAEETGSADDIWSHAWYHEYMTDDGVSTGRYSTEPEELTDGSMIPIGVFCHEYGHVLGLPDLYDTDGSSEGIGVYCLMAGGSWGALPGNPERPTHMSAEMKRRLGWMTPTEITGNLENLTILPAATNSDCYRVTNPANSGEYFLIENRAKIGFDSLFRGNGGLAIWHVDQSGNQRDETHRYVSLEQADGSGDLERDFGTGNRHPRTNRGDAGDLFPFLQGNDYFSFSSHPSSFSYDGSDAFMTIDKITQNGNDINVDILTSPEDPIYRFESYAIVDDSASNFNTEADSGEIVNLYVTLACDGVGSDVVAAQLSTSDTRVSVYSGHPDYYYASLGHNSYLVNSYNPFKIQVMSPNNDSAVTFTLSLMAEGVPYELDFKMNINRQNILVVLDNNGSHWSDNIVEALHQVGTYSFDVWSTSESGTPEYDDLIPYNAILWTTASYFGTRTTTPSYENCLSAEELDVLTAYLDAHGRVGLFSQDYLYDLGLNSFASNYLMVQSFTEDQLVDSIGGASGYYTGPGATATWSMYDYTDFIVPGTGANLSIMQNGTSNGVGLQYPAIAPSADFFATTFTSLAIERLDTPSLEGLLSDWLGWMMTNPGVDVPLPIAPDEGDTLETSPINFSWTPVDGAIKYQVIITTDFELTNIVDDIQSTEPQADYTSGLAEGDYFWAVHSMSATDTSAYSPRATFTFHIPYICGDANGDETVNVGDAVHIINYAFKGGPAPDPIAAGDANCDETCNVGDAVYIINYAFKGGPAPCANCP